MMPMPDPRLAAVSAAAREAGSVAMARWRGEFRSWDKVPGHVVCELDLELDALLRDRLRAIDGDAGWLSEETADTADRLERSRVWVVDPIDGTRGFAMKNGEFSIMVGLTRGDRVVLGVVVEPVVERVTYAVEGQGCYVRTGDGDPVRCRVTAVADLSEAVLTQSHSKRGAPPKAVVVALKPARLAEMYSAGVKLALVARGEADLYVNDYLNFHDWDICAGEILVTEAGGTVTLFDGGPVVYGGKGSPINRNRFE